MWIRPERLSHLMVQAEFYHQCRLAGLDCLLEVQVGCVRLDAAIIDAEEVIAVVEVKNHRRENGRERWLNRSKQCRKYLTLDLPLFLVDGVADIPRAVLEIRELISDGIRKAVV